MNKFKQLELISISSHHLERYKTLVNCALAGKWNDRFAYFENHHILPVSLFPECKDDDTNLVLVPAKVHYLLHYLLVKITHTNSMLNAFTCMRRIKSVKTPNCRLYGAARELFAIAQTKRRHYVNVKTKQQLFTFEKPIGDEWVAGNPSSGKGKPKGYKYWANNPVTGQCTAFAKDDPMPDGWVRGRTTGSNFNKFDQINKLKSVFCMKEKKSIRVDAKQDYHCTDPGRQIVDSNMVYIYNSYVMISPGHLYSMLNINPQSSNFVNPEKFVFSKPHHNMGQVMKEFSTKYQGQSLECLGVECVKLSDFTFKEGMVCI